MAAATLLGVLILILLKAPPTAGAATLAIVLITTMTLVACLKAPPTVGGLLPGLWMPMPLLAILIITRIVRGLVPVAKSLLVLVKVFFEATAAPVEAVEAARLTLALLGNCRPWNGSWVPCHPGLEQATAPALPAPAPVPVLAARLEEGEKRVLPPKGTGTRTTFRPNQKPENFLLL